MKSPFRARMPAPPTPGLKPFALLNYPFRISRAWPSFRPTMRSRFKTDVFKQATESFAQNVLLLCSYQPSASKSRVEFPAVDELLEPLKAGEAEGLEAFLIQTE